MTVFEFYRLYPLCQCWFIENRVQRYLRSIKDVGISLDEPLQQLQINLRKWRQEIGKKDQTDCFNQKINCTFNKIHIMSHVCQFCLNGFI